MLEIPESKTIAKQLDETVSGKTIKNVYANSSPHGFAFYFGQPEAYPLLLNGKTIEKVYSFGGYVEMALGSAKLMFNDGVNIRFLEAGKLLPKKHQLLVEFTDGTSIVCTVQMYGALFAFDEGQNDSSYYNVAKEKPSPLSGEFDINYFMEMFNSSKKNLSAKAFLATEQRIPGLGNGVLQDILFNAGINPKTKIGALAEDEVKGLFEAIKNTLFVMTEKGGRDTEKDLFGNPGGYKTILSKNTLNTPCAACGGLLTKQAYLGGNIYFCQNCQPMK